MRKIAVCGAGYVGLVTAACLASFGNNIICYDIDEERLLTLANGNVPIFERGLHDMLAQQIGSAALTFTARLSEAIADREMIFIAVGTPESADGTVDSTNVFAVARQIAQHVSPDTVIVNKSTVPVETSAQLAAIFSHVPGVEVVSNPEFLREGTAVQDFLHPDRIVIGTASARAVEMLKEVYAPIEAPIIITDARTAEMAKQASNAFLATKISFANEVAALCNALGADATAVLRIVGADRRIASGALEPGLGYGGSCLPKDLATLQQLGRVHGTPSNILAGAATTNEQLISRFAQRMCARLGELKNKRIAIFGLTFKGETDDVRCSPAVALIQRLRDVDHARIVAYDPAARAGLHGIERSDDPYVAAIGAEALVIATAWDIFKTLDLARVARSMKTPVLFDAVGCLERASATQAGFLLA